MQADYEDLLLKFETQVIVFYVDSFFFLVMIISYKKTIKRVCDSSVLLDITYCDSSIYIYITFLLGVQRTMSEIQIDCLTRKLAEADLFWGEKSNDYSLYYANKGTINGDKNDSLRELEAILVIKRLQDQVYSIFWLHSVFLFQLIFFSKLSLSQIKMLEMERSSSQQNLDSIVELATEQNISARNKFEEVFVDLIMHNLGVWSKPVVYALIIFY